MKQYSFSFVSVPGTCNYKFVVKTIGFIFVSFPSLINTQIFGIANHFAGKAIMKLLSVLFDKCLTVVYQMMNHLTRYQADFCTLYCYKLLTS